MRRAFGPVVLVLLWPASAGAQTSSSSSVPIPPPGAPGFLSRYAFYLNAASIANGGEDRQFRWDADIGAEVDLVNYGAGRFTLAANYEAILGHELRRFDPNQGNYTLELSSSVRVGTGEIAGVLHHVSRHLSDRAKNFPIDWNMLGVRYTAAVADGPVTLDISARALQTIKRSFVDYSSELAGAARVTYGVSQYVSVFGGSGVTLVGTAEEVSTRGWLVGASGEGGVRIAGRDGALELIVAVERRIDASPLVAAPRNWALVGFRLVAD